MNSPRRSLFGAVSLFLLSLIIGFGVRGYQRHFNVSDNPVDPSKRAQIIKAYGQLPLRFESNRGQTDARVKFISRSSGHTLFLTADEAVLGLRIADCGSRIGTASGSERVSIRRRDQEATLATARGTDPELRIKEGVPCPNESTNPQSAILRLRLIGANPRTKVNGLDELPGKSNYFLGDDPRRWRMNVANYARVEYDEVYPGVDLVWHGDQKHLEHDFIIAPGADPRRVKWSLAGARMIRIDERGELVAETAAGEMRLLKPQAWQDVNGERRPVACEYAIQRKHQIGFSLGAYDRSKELVIDPVLIYSSYIGGAGIDQAFGVAVDKDFNAYIVGQTSSAEFPGASPIQGALTGGVDAFLLKLNPSGNGVVYGTWIGGTSDEVARSVIVDADGNAYIAGFTFSRDFPKTSGAPQPSNGGSSDGFIAKLNPSGSALLYSSYVGGDGADSVTGVAIDASGNAYLSGSTQSSNLSASGIQAGRNSHGIYKSGDRAGNWAQTGAGLNTTQVLTVAVDPSNSSILYAGTQQGVYKSMNGGLQWQLTGQANPTTAPIIGNVIVVHPSDPNIIFVGSQFGGIFRSADGGQSYQTSVGISACNDITIDPVTPATIYAGTTQGAFKSVNGGNNWTPINTGLFPPFSGQFLRVNRLMIDPSNPSTVYAATNMGVFKTVKRRRRLDVGQRGFGAGCAASGCPCAGD